MALYVERVLEAPMTRGCGRSNGQGSDFKGPSLCDCYGLYLKWLPKGSCLEVALVGGRRSLGM